MTKTDFSWMQPGTKIWYQPQKGGDNPPKYSGKIASSPKPAGLGSSARTVCNLEEMDDQFREDHKGVETITVSRLSSITPR